MRDPDKYKCLIAKQADSGVGSLISVTEDKYNLAQTEAKSTIYSCRFIADPSEPIS